MDALMSNWLASCSRTPSMLSRITAITTAVTNRMEFTGVRRCGSRRANHAGARWSHPAVMGKPRQAGEQQAGGGDGAGHQQRDGERHGRWPAPEFPAAARRVCGMGPMTLMGCPPTKVSTELVPRMNISAMTGAEITTDWPMVRDALRHFAGEDGDILEAAERADGHLAEDGDAEPIELGHLPRDGLVVWMRPRHSAQSGRASRIA